MKPKESKAVAICPSPNLAYFNRVYSLDEMIGHIYGKIDLLEKVKRPNFFIKELELYMNYFNEELKLKGFKVFQIENIKFIVKF